MVDCLGDSCTSHPLILPDVAADNPTAAFKTHPTLLERRMRCSTMSANMQSMLKLLPSKPQNIRSSMTCFKQCVTSQKRSIFKALNSSSTKLSLCVRSGCKPRSHCGTRDLDTRATNTSAMRTSTSLVSQNLIAKPLFLINVPHAFKQNKQRFPQDHIQLVQQCDHIKASLLTSVSLAHH